MRSSLFFAEGHITTIDHAYIDHYGDIVGGTIAPAFEVDGDIEVNEQVVIDFSYCKKQIKNIIDDNETGIDHKLVIGDWSNITEVKELGVNHLVVETPKWSIEGPGNMFHFARANSYQDMYEYIGEFVESKLLKQYQGIKVYSWGGRRMGMMPDWMETPSLFRYTHGLSKSTSWGCQNIAHGHLSYIAIEGYDSTGATILQQKIASDLDNSMFVFRQNLQEDSSISYETPRGFFRLLPKEAPVKTLLVDTETTIENLVQFVADKYEKELDEVQASKLYVSEGLFKGSTIEF